jgi:hypothetical protein
MSQTARYVELPTGGYQIYLLGPKGTTFEINLARTGGPPAKLRDVPDAEYSRRTLGTWNDPPYGSLWAGGDGPMFTEDGFGLTGIWAESVAQLQTTSGSCYFGPGGPTSPPPTAFAPGCPWFSPNREAPFMTAFSQPSTGPGLSGHVHVSWPLQRGTWSIGSWLSTSGKVENAKAIGVWLEFQRPRSVE